jgi:hypothetical protein
LAAVIAIVLALAVRTPAQSAPAPALQPGKILGTVIDVNGDPVAVATVALTDTYPGDRRTVVTPENGFFQFDNVQPGVQYLIIVSAEGFADWTSPAITLESGQVNLLGAVQLRIATARATVEVNGNSAEIATEQVKMEEKQRILGLIPNFYVAYDADAEPLTAALKFRLALKISVDPATIAGITVISAAKQAANTPAYGQGASGFGERLGATGADGFVDIMIGGAILPSVLHQDPRYSTREPAQPKPGFGTRFWLPLSAGEITESGSRTTPAWAVIWLQVPSPTSTIQRRIAERAWCSQISPSALRSASAPAWLRNFSWGNLPTAVAT